MPLRLASKGNGTRICFGSLTGAKGGALRFLGEPSASQRPFSESHEPGARYASGRLRQCGVTAQPFSARWRFGGGCSGGTKMQVCNSRVLRVGIRGRDICRPAREQLRVGGRPGICHLNGHSGHREGHQAGPQHRLAQVGVRHVRLKFSRVCKQRNEETITCQL